MAIWQFKFFLVPGESISRHHQATPVVIDRYRPIKELSKFDEHEEFIDYWRPRNPKEFSDKVATLLPQRTSWSENALMFGDEEGDTVSLWDDDFSVALDMRSVNHRFLDSIIELAQTEGCYIAVGETGRLIAADRVEITKQMKLSRAFKFIENPEETLDRISREE